MLGLTVHFTNLINSLMMEGRPNKVSESPKFNEEHGRGVNHPALNKYDIDA